MLARLQFVGAERAASAARSRGPGASRGLPESLLAAWRQTQPREAQLRMRTGMRGGEQVKIDALFLKEVAYKPGNFVGYAPNPGIPLGQQARPRPLVAQWQEEYMRCAQHSGPACPPPSARVLSRRPACTIRPVCRAGGLQRTLSCFERAAFLTPRAPHATPRHPAHAGPGLLERVVPRHAWRVPDPCAAPCLVTRRAPRARARAQP